MDIHEIAPDESTHTMWEPPGSGYGEESGVSADHGLDDTTGLDGPGHDTPGQDDTTSPDGGPDAAPGGTDSTDSTGGQSTGSDSGGTNTGSMTVEVEGQSRTLPTSHDYTGDGRPDATVQTEDGKLIVFADTDNNTTGDGAPDGKA
ncbi:MAG TPA: hypothetical protein VMU51_30285, partial [Mycobacteriales bacterium]|nr:hypothetical protein [Mycobacteriales bacterium]